MTYNRWKAIRYLFHPRLITQQINYFLLSLPGKQKKPNDLQTFNINGTKASDGELIAFNALPIILRDYFSLRKTCNIFLSLKSVFCVCYRKPDTTNVPSMLFCARVLQWSSPYFPMTNMSVGDISG